MFFAILQEKGVCSMAKTIYRICLIVCLAIAIMAGLFLYDRYQQDQEREEEWLLVWTEQETPSI